MKYSYSFLVILFILISSGCEKKYIYTSKTNDMVIKDKKSEALSERAMDYWESFSAKDFNSTYQYELPFQQYLKSKLWYVRFNAGNTKGYFLEQKEIEYIDENRAIIKIKFSKNKSGGHMISDRWYLIDGVWYHKMKTSILPSYEEW